MLSEHPGTLDLEAVRSSAARVPHHPLGTQAKVLLTSVFGPYAQDDEYGSRALNPMELWHNQVTRVQGPFSLRMFNRSWGLMLIQANIEAPCVLLDFPTLDRFVAELRAHRYDIVGISAIPPNLLKVQKMCELVRQYQPHAKIVVGGHVANVPNVQARVGADHVVQGEGVRWFRSYLHEDPDQPIRHPQIHTGVATRVLGMAANPHLHGRTATLIPSVGCPLGCDFCATSAMFGGKGKFISFYETGDELFEIMCQLETGLGVDSFFVMDENFLLNRKRALRLLELMEANDKNWSLEIFSSAEVVRSYTMEQLASLGLSWLWLGLEGEQSGYRKLGAVDTFALVRELQSHGVRVLGSTIIGLHHHTPQNIDQAIDWAVRHEADFHQFMLYCPSPGTPFFQDLAARGQIKDETEFPWADWHGQRGFSWRHPRITDGQETEFILRAFHRDFERNGPSVLRTLRTLLSGWQRYKDHPQPRLRRRLARETGWLAKSGAAMAAAAREYYSDQPVMHAKLSALVEDLCTEFGECTRHAAQIAAPHVLAAIRAEEERLAAGWTYEPPTFYEINDACRHRFAGDYPQAGQARYVTCAGDVARPATRAA